MCDDKSHNVKNILLNIEQTDTQTKTKEYKYIITNHKKFSPSKFFKISRIQ